MKLKRQPWAWKCQLCGEITETSTKKREPATVRAVKHFSNDDLERVNKVISKMKENGEIRLVPTESKITVWQLTPKEGEADYCG